MKRVKNTSPRNRDDGGGEFLPQAFSAAPKFNKKSDKLDQPA
jgi:hypothetical protein